MTALAATPFVLLAAHIPSHLLLPGVAALAFAVAAVTTAAGWFMRADRSGDSVTVWDFAGAFAFVGVAAGAFSDPHQVLLLFGAAIAAP